MTVCLHLYEFGFGDRYLGRSVHDSFVSICTLEAASDGCDLNSESVREHYTCALGMT